MTDHKPSFITANQTENGEIQSVSMTVPASITANHLESGETQSASITVEQAVEFESKIPPDAKKAVREFIEEQLQQINEAAGEFIINIPDNLSQYAEVILELIQRFLG